MKHWYSLLTAEEKEFVRGLVGDFKTKLNDRTLKEHLAKAVVKHRDGGIIKSVIFDEVRESLADGEVLASKRRKAVEIPTYLAIYNGVVTASLLSGLDIVKADDKIVWDNDDDDDDRRKCIKFQDIFHLSALYCAIRRNSRISRDNRIKVGIDDVFNVAHPNLNPSEAMLKEFGNEVCESVSRFEQLGGNYYKDKKDEINFIDIRENPFFVKYDGDLFTESECGYGNTCFEISDYQLACERQKRLVGIGETYLHGDTMEEDAVLAYLVYRHQYAERNSKIKSVILLQTLKENLCVERRLKDDEVRVWIGKLKPLFKNCEVRDGRISWKKGGKDNGKE